MSTTKVGERPLTLAVALDGTILEFDYGKWRSDPLNYFGTLKKDALYVLNELKRGQYRIIIHTSRVSFGVESGRSLEVFDGIKRVLSLYRVPYDEIWVGRGKPLADYYIDNKAICFRNWMQVLESVK